MHTKRVDSQPRFVVGRFFLRSRQSSIEDGGVPFVFLWLLRFPGAESPEGGLAVHVNLACSFVYCPAAEFLVVVLSAIR